MTTTNFPMPVEKHIVQFCKICEKQIPHHPDYPNYICQGCVNLTTDANGRRVRFGNLDFKKGLGGFYVDKDQNYPLDTCFVKGKLCKVKKVKMGVVIIELVI